jgi:hypothetical protein
MIPSSHTREELEMAGWQFERRLDCPAEGCGATIELWRKVPGLVIPFRLKPLDGKLCDHREECPGKQTQKVEEPTKPVKVKRERELQGSLFR